MMKLLSVHQAALGGFLLLLSAVGLGEPAYGQAQGQAPASGELVVHAYRLENQPAVEALTLVYPLLSPRGTVELKPQENTLVIRDSLAAVVRIIPTLTRFDHPKRELGIQIQIVRASLEKFSPPSQSQLSQELLLRLRELLPYDTYELLAETRLEAFEGEQMSYRLGRQFDIKFRLGTLLEGRRLRLHGFQVDRISASPKSRRGNAGKAASNEPKSLVQTNLFLHLDQVFFLGLAADESSREALMVVITARIVSPQEFDGFGVATPGLDPKP
jgi:hypothetical protein